MKYPTLQKIGEHLHALLEKETWSVRASDFWTTPFDFIEISSVDPKLDQFLQSSSLVVFKGDLNYRKLVGDRKWRPETPFEEATGGKKFIPATNFVVIRTLKADTVAGLDPELPKRLSVEDKNWMTDGAYGVVQLRTKFK